MLPADTLNDPAGQAVQEEEPGAELKYPLEQD
jgi:hypothetical protein